jgi:hypothetical protein
MLVFLDVENSDVDAAVVNKAVDGRGQSLNLNASSPVDDYVLLAGRSGQYIFSKITSSGGNISEKIEYHAGAKVGDLAKKTIYGAYTSGVPASIIEIPYVLTSGDLITP